MRHYRKYFRGKIVFCNADDPAFSDNNDGDHYGDGCGGYTSNFWRYFQLNFEQLGIKKLIATHFDPHKPTYKLELSGDRGKDGKITNLNVVKTPLKQNGDFRSPECVELLKECDVVVTNPPFSLMALYIPMMMQSGKKFIVLANMNHITFKEIFHYFKNNQIWLGYNSGHFWFKVPDYYPEKPTDYKVDKTGQKLRRMGNCCWFTNIDIDIRHQPVDLFRHYSPEKYPTYDTYDAIECGKYSEIPDDTDKIIGVPVSYLPYHCNEQFEIIGKLDGGTAGNVLDLAKPIINGKSKYKRIAIRRRKPNEN